MPDIKLEDKVELSDDVVFREVGGEFVLLDLVSGTYFGLNEVGGRIWQMLSDQALTLTQVCDVIETEYEVERTELEKDILGLAKELVERKLLLQSA